MTANATTHDLYDRARQVLPGGVTAAARVNRALGHPFYVERAQGPFVYDTDGRRYIDFCTSNGATLLGHAHPTVLAAVRNALERGVACAYDGEPQIALAERLVADVPALELVRFTTTGTEATSYAVRIARTYTGRTRVLKFEGHFHGYNDALAFSFWPPADQEAGSAVLKAQTETAGLPPSSIDNIFVAPFNDTEAFRAALDRHGDELAAVILEPINYDSGAIVAQREFLDVVRTETARRGIVLIFDEILSAYRTGRDCAQGYLGVVPDLCVLGKAIGGGFPLSVFGGQRELMSVVAPLGHAAHTGTYNAHLVAILAAHGFLDVVSEKDFYPHLLALSQRCYVGLQQVFTASGLPVRVQGVGARCGLYFGLDPAENVVTYKQAARLDWSLLQAFCRAMHARGVYVNPAWHHGICATYTEALVDELIEATDACARELRAGQWL